MAFLKGNKLYQKCRSCGGDGRKTVYTSNGDPVGTVACATCEGTGYIEWGWVMADEENTPFEEND